jgi:Fe-S oxidoreductase
MGNEYLFQTQAAQNIATLDGAGAHKIVTTCAHCFNTLGDEYPDLGGRYEVVHHTQLLAELVAGSRLVPGPMAATVTYHDACYLSRHNDVIAEPRAILDALPSTTSVEMARNAKRSFCCGAGGARMWMEEREGTRINLDRIDEAMATGADVVATACPYCRIMLDDAVATRGQESLNVLDVAQLLERSIDAASNP